MRKETKLLSLRYHAHLRMPQSNLIVEPATESFANLGELLASKVREAPEKGFLFSEVDDRQYTYTQFQLAVARLATMLVANRVRKGDVVSLLLPNSVEYVIAYFACWQIGAIAGPVNSLLKAQEIAYVVTNSEAKAILVHSQFGPLIDPLRPALTTLQTVIQFDDEAEVTREFSGAMLPAAEASLDDEAIIIYTSGTTGKPKGCLLTHRNLIANARQISQWLGFTNNDRLLTIMPLFHMNAVSVTTMAALYAGGATVVSLKFSASRFWEIIS